MNLAALQLPANSNIALSVYVDLKDRLGDMETDSCDRLHTCLVPIVVTSAFMVKFHRS